MSKLVLLKLGDGSLEQGFPVALRFGEEGQLPIIETTGRLPAAPELRQLYQNWADLYRRLNFRLRLEAETLQVPQVSRRAECHQAARLLTDQLNHWLYADSFRAIREKLLERLMPSDQVRLILQTEDPDLQRLPWHLWDLCDRYPNTEIALGASVYEWIEPVRPIQTVPRQGVQILAILGSSKGIDIQTDRRLLEALPGAEISFLIEPSRQALTQALWQQSWDILFFAGHSCSGERVNPLEASLGQIALNPDDSLSLNQLKYALRRVVERGLQVAIFNSCDSLGLAHELEDLKIPQVIVMREPVPDQVAQTFLKSFLTAFSRGEPFYLAVREAREILQGIEDSYPCATWLPVICQNPAVIPPTWQTLGGDLLTLSSPFPTQALAWTELAKADSLASASPKAGPPQGSASPDLSETLAESLDPLDLSQSPLIHNRYQIQRLLGQGGFGRTYLANDTHRFDDLCVLKQFAPANRSPGILERSRELFEREAKVLYQINHPQIPKFLAWFTQEGQLFIVEEYIDGSTYLGLLEERRRRLPAESDVNNNAGGQLFSEAEIIQWLKDLLPVLDYLHGINIIHRDISPGNIILPRQRSQPVLIDFGVVKEVASQIWSMQFGSFQAIQQASRIGKPGYSPPEQMQLGQCYPCSDLYALGMTALVLLTGRNPHWLIEPSPSGVARWVAQVSQPLRAIFEKLLAENPRQRYQSAQAVLNDLKAFPALVSSISPIPPPTLPPTPQSRFSQASPAILPAPIPAVSPHSFQPSTQVQPAVPSQLPQLFLEQCQRELVRCAGPMATYIFEEVMQQTPQTAADLIALLAAEIPDSRQAKQFKERAALIQPPTPQMARLVQTDWHPDLKPQAAPHQSAPAHSNLADVDSISVNSASSLPPSPKFIEHCRRELAQQIGPIAHCIVDEIWAESPHLPLSQFVQAIIAEIPSSKQADAFQKQLQRFLNEG